jgi:hypothetical protein
MKKLLLSLGSLLAFGLMATAQTNGSTAVLNADFENTPVGFSSWSASTYECVANPHSDAVNSSAKVAKYTVAATPQGWWGFGSAIGGAIQWNAAGDTLSFKVYCAKAITVVIHIENLEDYNVFSKQDTIQYTTPGSWQILKVGWANADTFTSAIKTHSTYTKNNCGTKLTIYPEAGGGTAGDIIYMDDFTGLTYKYNDVTINPTILDPNKAMTAANVTIKEGKAGTLTTIPLVKSSDGLSWTATTTVKGYTIKENGDTQTWLVFYNGAVNNTDSIGGSTLYPNGGNFPIAASFTFSGLTDDKGVATIYKVSTPPTIDGAITAGDPWSNQPKHYWIHSGGTVQATAQSYWQMVWDDDYCYILGVIQDKHLNSSNVTSWQNDCQELFFHMNSTENAAGAYAAEDMGDWQIRTQWNHPDFIDGENGTVGTSATDQSALQPLLSASTIKQTTQATATDTTGYTIEWKMPWSILIGGSDFAAAVDSHFKFTSSLADNLTGTRVGQWFWYGTADGAYNNTGLEGVLTLKGELVSVGSVNAANMSLYPSVTTGLIHLSSVANTAVVFSVDGKEMANLKNVNTIDASNFGSGMYFVKVNNSQVLKFVRK